MTEEKRQSTAQPEQIQGFNSPAEDELNLIDLLKFLARKKVFILAVTSVCTLFSIFYAQSITPIYRATVSLLENNEGRSSLSTLEQLDPEVANQVFDKIITPHTIFESFLFNIKSHELKQEVYVNGGFQEKFFRETGIDTDQSVSAIYNSTKIIKGDRSANLELEGYKPKVMLEFLIALVEAAKENANTEINDIQRSIVKTRINNLSKEIKELLQNITAQKQIEKEIAAAEIKELNQKIALEKQLEKEQKAMEIEELRQEKQLEKEQKAMEIEELRQQEAMEIEELRLKIALQKQLEKEKEAMEIARFSKALAIAKHMGIKNNNFDKPGAEKFPLWLRYGELALQQEIRSLRSQEKISNTKSLPLLKLEAKFKLKKLQQEENQKIRSLGSKEKVISKTQKLSIEKEIEATEIKELHQKIALQKQIEKERLKLKRFQQKIRSLMSKEKVISNTKSLPLLKLENLKLKRSQIADLPLQKFKVATISKRSHSLLKPNQPWVIVGFGVAVGLVIGIFMAFLIEAKQLRAKKIQSASP